MDRDEAIRSLRELHEALGLPNQEMGIPWQTVRDRATDAFGALGLHDIGSIVQNNTWNPSGANSPVALVRAIIFHVLSNTDERAQVLTYQVGLLKLRELRERIDRNANRGTDDEGRATLRIMAEHGALDWIDEKQRMTMLHDRPADPYDLMRQAIDEVLARN